MTHRDIIKKLLLALRSGATERDKDAAALLAVEYLAAPEPVDKVAAMQRIVDSNTGYVRTTAPKAEPDDKDLTIAYMAGYHEGKTDAQPKAEPCGYDETTGNCTRNPCCHPAPKAEPVNAQMLKALIDIAYGLESARIWGGMDWTYNPLHPYKYLPLRDKARAAIKAAEQVQPTELTEQETVAWLITHGEDFFATNEEAYAMSFAEDERQELVLRTPQGAKTCQYGF